MITVITDDFIKIRIESKDLSFFISCEANKPQRLNRSHVTSTDCIPYSHELFNVINNIRDETSLHKGPNALYTLWSVSLELWDVTFVWHSGAGCILMGR